MSSKLYAIGTPPISKTSNYQWNIGTIIGIIFIFISLGIIIYGSYLYFGYSNIYKTTAIVTVPSVFGLTGISYKINSITYNTSIETGNVIYTQGQIFDIYYNPTTPYIVFTTNIFVELIGSMLIIIGTIMLISVLIIWAMIYSFWKNEL